MKAPIKDMPAELNRRLDELDTNTRIETIIKRIRETPIAGRSVPNVAVTENMSLGPWQATDSTITLTAHPVDLDTYEFAVQIGGRTTVGWDTKITHDNVATFMGLRPNTQYAAKVRGIDIFENSTPWSEEIVILTDMDRASPPVPQGLDLVADGWYVRCKVNEIKLTDVPDFDGFAFYVSQTTGFTPSDDNLKFVGRSNRFVFHTPDVGITYYVRVKSYDVNGNYSQACAEVSIVVPPPRIPPGPDDPVEPGQIVIVEGTEEIDDCDSHLTWESEAGGIQLATDAETLKEGTGALKISVDKYAPVAENLWYTKPNPPWPPELPAYYLIGSSPTGSDRYIVQGFKVGANCNIKRIGIPLRKEVGQAPPGCKVMLYDDDGDGNLDNKLGEAEFAGITTSEAIRWADFDPVVAVVAGTQYYLVICRTDEGTGDCYESRQGENRYGDTQYDYVRKGNALDNLTSYMDVDILFRVFSDEESLNQHFKISALEAKDISLHERLEYWIKSNKTVADWLQASMGEAALGEKTDNVTPGTSWTSETWDISEIAVGDRDLIAHFGFKVLDSEPLDDPPSADDGKVWIWIDYIRATRNKALKIKFSDELVTIYPPSPIVCQNNAVVCHNNEVVYN